MSYSEIDKIVTVVHSQSKNAWNVVGIRLGGHWKWARCPYDVIESDDRRYEAQNTRSKAEALERARFIAKSINDGWGWAR